jgi:hypothetical protein
LNIKQKTQAEDYIANLRGTYYLVFELQQMRLRQLNPCNEFTPRRQNKIMRTKGTSNHNPYIHIAPDARTVFTLSSVARRFQVTGETTLSSLGWDALHEQNYDNVRPLVRTNARTCLFKGCTCHLLCCVVLCSFLVATTCSREPLEPESGSLWGEVIPVPFVCPASFFPSAHTIARRLYTY